MAVIHIEPDPGNTYEISGDDDRYILDLPTFIYTTAAPAILVTSAATGNTLDIRGSLGTPGDDAAIIVQGQDTAIRIAEGGFIGAKIGVELQNVSSDIVNRGLVGVDDAAFILTQSAGRMVNYGSITTGSLGYAVSQSASTGTFTLENHGTIAAYGAFLLAAPELIVKLGKTSEIHGSIGFLITSGVGDTARITNLGLVSTSAGYAYNGGDGQDVIVNRGTIRGDIIFDGGDDRFTDKGRFEGTLSGGAGDDTFILRRATEVVELASGGTDTIRIGRSFALADEIENLTGLGRKNISLTGNDEANIIKGNAGNNVIAGDGAADTLTGGGGRDVFDYAKFGGGDTITDFEQGSDRIRIEGFTQYTRFSDLDIVRVGQDVRISFADENGADFILVEDQKVADFAKGDFIFA